MENISDNSLNFIISKLSQCTQTSVFIGKIEKYKKIHEMFENFINAKTILSQTIAMNKKYFPDIFKHIAKIPENKS